MSRQRVAVVGATGIAGQQFRVALDRHPWFDVVMLAASERSAGKRDRWSPMPRALEPRNAKTAAVVSTASAFRYDDHVPILRPGVNLAHAAQIDVQRRRRGWRGFIA